MSTPKEIRAIEDKASDLLCELYDNLTSQDVNSEDAWAYISWSVIPSGIADASKLSEKERESAADRVKAILEAQAQLIAAKEMK